MEVGERVLVDCRRLFKSRISRSCLSKERITEPMSTIIEKIKAIEDEMAKTQKNKATSYHLGKSFRELLNYILCTLHIRDNADEGLALNEIQ